MTPTPVLSMLVVATTPDTGSITGTKLALGAAIAVGTVLLGKLLPAVLRPILGRRRSPSAARVFSAVAGGIVILLGLLIALAVTFPSIDPIAVLSSLGVLGIAAGFAFQDILSNLLAGMLLLLRDPFRGGDQITVAGLTGTVVEINLRETVLTSFDGRRLTIPNATVYGNPIIVQTAFAHVRTSVVVGVDYATDLPRARQLAQQAVEGVDGVLAQPGVEIYASTLSTSTVDLEIRWWTAPQQGEIRRVQDGVIGAVLAAYTGAGIDMPDAVVVLQGSPSLTASIHDRGAVTPGGSVRP